MVGLLNVNWTLLLKEAKRMSEKTPQTRGCQEKHTRINIQNIPGKNRTTKYDERQKGQTTETTNI